jgi:hypothetical protein
MSGIEGNKMSLSGVQSATHHIGTSQGKMKLKRRTLNEAKQKLFCLQSFFIQKPDVVC